MRKRRAARRVALALVSAIGAVPFMAPAPAQAETAGNEQCAAHGFASGCSRVQLSCYLWACSLSGEAYNWDGFGTIGGRIENISISYTLYNANGQVIDVATNSCGYTRPCTISNSRVAAGTRSACVTSWRNTATSAPRPTACATLSFSAK
jgi:hypothetical protein